MLTYDLAYDPAVDLAEGLEARDAWSLWLLSRNAKSETNEEKDIFLCCYERDDGIDAQNFFFRTPFNERLFGRASRMEIAATCTTLFEMLGQ